MIQTSTVKTALKPAYTRYDLIVVGGGIVGLATAREFLKRRPGTRLVVLEKEAVLVAHQSGHNSGVIHTGIYYTPGSLKARACVEGHRLMIDFCREKGIAFELSGKLIVALDQSELGRLEELYRRGLSNGVQGLEMVGPERLREIEPFATGLRAIWSPNTGIIDYKEVAYEYAREILALGGEIVTGCRVNSLDSATGSTRLAITTSQNEMKLEQELETRFVITCGGLYSDKLAAMSERSPDGVKIVPFRGDYYVLRSDRRHLVRSMIYPVPDPEFPFLGVHFTRRLDGEVWAGPNAVLAFAREGYTRWKIKPGELGEVLAFGGFRKLARKYWKTGLSEMYRDYYKKAYLKALQRYMPEIKAEDLLPGPSGVRAQALNGAGQLVDDFLITFGPNVIHVQNAPSPAATSSLVIGRMIVEEAERGFQLD